MVIDGASQLIPKEDHQLCPSLLLNYCRGERGARVPSSEDLSTFMRKEIGDFLNNFENLENIILDSQDLE